MPYADFMRTIVIPITAVSLLAAGCSASPSPDPSPETGGRTVSSCGLDLSVDAAPERAVTLEQGATELLLALGLGDAMIGTSYLTDAVAPEFADAYAQIPVLADQYPTAE